MKYKYGIFSQEQLHEYKKLLHNKIHWLLIYEESSYPKLDEYISSLQFQIAALAELINSPQIINLADIIECIRIEYQKDSHNHKKYRKLVFDAHSVVDLLPETDGDSNGRFI